MKIATRLSLLIMSLTSIPRTTHTFILEKVMKTYKKKFTNTAWFKMNSISMTKDRCRTNSSFENVKAASFNDLTNQKALLSFFLRSPERSTTLPFRPRCVSLLWTTGWKTTIWRKTPSVWLQKGQSMMRRRSNTGTHLREGPSSRATRTHNWSLKRTKLRNWRGRLTTTECFNTMLGKRRKKRQ